MISDKIWREQLSAEERQIIQEEFTAAAIYNNDLVYDAEAKVQAELEQKGMQFFPGTDLPQYRLRARKWFDNNKSLTPGFYDKLLAEISKVLG
jgi:TRAP-type C4-dicarboxylate transport system substrate-binding protein